MGNRFEKGAGRKGAGAQSSNASASGAAVAAGISDAKAHDEAVNGTAA